MCNIELREGIVCSEPARSSVAYCRQRAQGSRARNSEMKRSGTRERVIRPGGAPEANAELAASLAYVCVFSDDVYVVKPLHF